jgi:hypothetical protein
VPTTRSLFTFEQFSKVFQKLAHKLAIEAVTLKPGRITIKTFESRELSEVSTKDHTIRFYFSHFSFSYHPGGRDVHPDAVSFDIEEKLYTTSPHCTKISFYSPEYRKTEGPKVKGRWGFEKFPVDHEKTDAEKKRRKKRIEDFLEKLMKEAGIKPVARFSLKEYPRSKA